MRTTHGARICRQFFCIFCSGDPWKMLLLFRIGILSIDSNRRHQSTTANNGKWNVHTSKDDKTSIVTRHKCDAVTAVTFDAIGEEKMEHVLLFGPFYFLVGSSADWGTHRKLVSCVWLSIHFSYSHNMQLATVTYTYFTWRPVFQLLAFIGWFGFFCRIRRTRQFDVCVCACVNLFLICVYKSRRRRTHHSIVWCGDDSVDDDICPHINYIEKK